MERNDLIQRLRHLVSLNEPRNGGPYQGTAALACVDAMREAAATIERLTAEKEEAERDAIEKCAKIADQEAEWWGFDAGSSARVAASRIRQTLSQGGEHE